MPWLGHSLRHTNHISEVKEWLIRDMTCINKFGFNNFFLTIHTSSKFDFKTISKLAWNNSKSAMFVLIICFYFDKINEQKKSAKTDPSNQVVSTSLSRSLQNLLSTYNTLETWLIIDFRQNLMVFNGSGSTVQILENVKFWRCDSLYEKTLKEEMLHIHDKKSQPLTHLWNLS